MGDRHPRPLLVVDRDRGKAVVLREPVHQHHGQFGRRRLGQQPVVQRRGGQHEAVDVTGPHLLEKPALTVGVGIGVAEQGYVARRGQLVFQAAHDGRENRVVQVRNQHADAVRAPGTQAPRDGIRPVAHRRGGRDHPACRLLADQQASFRVEGARCGGGMHTRGRRHVPQGGRSVRHRSSRSPRRASRGIARFLANQPYPSIVTRPLATLSAAPAHRWNSGPHSTGPLVHPCGPITGGSTGRGPFYGQKCQRSLVSFLR